jgi:hypothetical protein
VLVCDKSELSSKNFIRELESWDLKRVTWAQEYEKVLSEVPIDIIKTGTRGGGKAIVLEIHTKK